MIWEIDIEKLMGERALIKIGRLYKICLYGVLIIGSAGAILMWYPFDYW